jgi:Ca-activated chloride channel homolog
VQPPTDDKEKLLEAIDRFDLQRGTATGSALYVALATLFPDAGIDIEALTFPGGFYGGAGRARRLEPAKPKSEPKPFKPVAPGSNTNSVIILMSDGRRTTGPDPLDAAKVAADRGVRVFTVGFGTAAGGLIGFEGWSVYVRLDEETLKSVADVTRAEYFYAGTSADLRKVYRNLNSKLVLERKNVEITSLITMAAALLVVLALGLSLWWSSRNLR